MTDDIFCITAPSRASEDRGKLIVPVGALAAAAYRQPPAAPWNEQVRVLFSSQ
jgi:hypothetical protein